MNVAIVKMYTQDDYNRKTAAPHFGVYGKGGVGKSRLCCDLAAEPLNLRVFYLETEGKPLPDGLANLVYSRGGAVTHVDTTADLESVCGDYHTARANYDAVVVDGWSASNRQGIEERKAKDARWSYLEEMRAMHRALILLKNAGNPIFSTMGETWQPTNLRRDLSDPNSKHYGEIVSEGLVPEEERKYTVGLPKALIEQWPPTFVVLGRLRVQLPRGTANPAKLRWIQLMEMPGKEDAKSEYHDDHYPGLVLPYGTNAAFLLMHPWLREVRPLSTEQQDYLDKYNAWKKKGITAT